MSQLQQNIKKLHALVGEAKTILVLQPEKPDTDSLTSSLALEQILGDLGKEVLLYCKDKLPRYISYFEGADRVQDDFPSKFDMAILVDTGGPQQVGRTLEKYQSKLAKKPFVIIDHHGHREPMPFETIDVVDDSITSTCELVVNIARQLDWTINQDAASLLIPGILADTRNLTIATVTPTSFRVVADLIELGADINKIHEAYRNADALVPELLQLKGRLLSRLELFCDNKIALVTVTPEELKQYAEIHDPSDLVIYEMQWLKGVEVAVVIREYHGEGTKIKISTRARMPVAAKTCQHFGGGGHDRAAGAQVNDRPVEEVKAEFIKVLCQNIKEYEDAHATV